MPAVHPPPERSRELSEGERRLVERHLALAAAVARARPGLRSPYFGHLRVSTGGGQRDVLLGDATVVAEHFALLDWRTAPLAEAFFAGGPGEPYEIEAGGRTLEGTVLERTLVRFEDRALVEVDTGDALLRREGEAWLAGPRRTVRLVPRDAATRRRGPSMLVPLDATQRAAVERPPQESLLVLGDAGYGKTTVALYRLAHLHRLALASRSRLSALVVVPTEGLARLTRQVLERLGVPGVEVTTFEAWITAQGRRLFRDVPARCSTEVPPSVTRLKRHPALRTVLPAVARGTEAMRRLGEIDPRGPARRRDLLHLFGDRELLARVIAEAGGELPPRAAEETLAHTRIQFSATTERAMAHVDADRLRTLDGRRIDEGTPLANAESLDAADFPVLFELNRLRRGSDRTPAGHLPTWDHVVVDEAQELASLELAVLGRARAPGGSLTVAGDERQQVDDTTAFGGWPAVMTELGVPRADRVTLRVSYRCPPAVEAMARSLFSSLEEEETGADPSAVVLSRHDGPGPRCAAMIQTLVELRDVDPTATIAVIARHRETALALATELARGVDLHLALDGDVRLAPGVQVTCVEEVKGLEFDVVVVPDADAANYPDTPEARRALYVALTRTTHQLWVTAAGAWSPLLRRVPAQFF